jgi:hypothetical protein
LLINRLQLCEVFRSLQQREFAPNQVLRDFGKLSVQVVAVHHNGRDLCPAELLAGFESVIAIDEDSVRAYANRLE